MAELGHDSPYGNMRTRQNNHTAQPIGAYQYFKKYFKLEIRDVYSAAVEGVTNHLMLLNKRLTVLRIVHKDCVGGFVSAVKFYEDSLKSARILTILGAIEETYCNGTGEITTSDEVVTIVNDAQEHEKSKYHNAMLSPSPKTTHAKSTYAPVTIDLKKHAEGYDAKINKELQPITAINRIRWSVNDNRYFVLSITRGNQDTKKYVQAYKMPKILAGMSINNLSPVKISDDVRNFLQKEGILYNPENGVVVLLKDNKCIIFIKEMQISYSNIDKNPKPAVSCMSRVIDCGFFAYMEYKDMEYKESSHKKHKNTYTLSISYNPDDSISDERIEEKNVCGNQPQHRRSHSFTGQQEKNTLESRDVYGNAQESQPPKHHRSKSFTAQHQQNDKKTFVELAAEDARRER